MGLASNIPIFIFSLLIWLADSFFLLFPSFAPDEKRKDGVLMNAVYGPLIGIRNGGGFFDGVLVSCMLLPIAALVFVPGTVVNYVVICCSLAISGFLPVIGVYMAVTGFLPGFAPVAFSLLGLMFGMCGGTNRVGALAAGPAVTLAVWQSVWNVVFACYVRRMIVRMRKIPSVMKIQRAKVEQFGKNGGVWPKGADRPTGADVSAELEADANAELDSLSYDPVWKHAAVSIVLIAAVSYALYAQPVSAKDAEWDVKYVMIPQMIGWVVVTFLVTLACVTNRDKFLGTSGGETTTSYNTM